MTELASLPNPFRDNVVQDAWQSTVDIAEIHASAFSACMAGIDSAARGVPDSLLIYGAAGSGKTHLLARLQRHLAETARCAPDNVLRCVFTFVRLQTSPQLLWQHVRRRLASDLMRREQGLTQLQRLIAHQLGIVAGRTARAGILELRVLRSQDQEALSGHVQAVATKLGLPRNLCVVLEELIFNRNVRDASSWLMGDSLPERVLDQLGVGTDLDEDREEAARHVVTALCRLAGETLPLVFCFDQVESLQRSASDDESLFRFGRMAADLYDSDANVFLITCLQSALLDQLKRAIRIADFDRMARRSALLEPLTSNQVERLVQSRLEWLPEVAAARKEVKNDPFFPLTKRFVSELSFESPCVPRRVLALAARAYEQAQHGRVAPIPTAAEFLGGELQRRQKENLTGLEPSQTERVVVQGAPLLAHMIGGQSKDDSEGAHVFIDGAQNTAISIRNEADGRSLTPRLKRLLAGTPRKDGAKLVIVRDPRLPISKTAVKAREHLKELEDRGASVLEPTIEALAALEALASILADAKSGDLANEDAQLEPGAVLAWLKSLRSDLILEPVQELISELLKDTVTLPDKLDQDLADLMSHEHVVSAEMAAQILGQPEQRVVEVARTSSARYLLLEGPPVLLLDVAGVSVEQEAAS